MSGFWGLVWTTIYINQKLKQSNKNKKSILKQRQRKNPTNTDDLLFSEAPFPNFLYVILASFGKKNLNKFQTDQAP